MRYGIVTANLGEYADPRVAVRLARVAEAAGWEAFFVWDHLGFVRGVSSGDPYVILSAVAASTTRLKLGLAVTPLARRRPQVVANAVASLDLLSGGRAIFGAGLGGVPDEFTAFGESGDARQENEVFVRELGAAETIDHTREDLVGSVLVAHPDGIEAVVDVVSDREALGRIAGLVKKGGRVASSVFAADADSLARHGIKATNVRTRPDARRLVELARLVDAGEISVRVERTFPLERAPEALEASRTGHVRGKIVLLVDRGARSRALRRSTVPAAV
jgi:hypothetical protein